MTSEKKVENLGTPSLLSITHQSKTFNSSLMGLIKQGFNSSQAIVKKWWWKKTLMEERDFLLVSVDVDRARKILPPLPRYYLPLYAELLNISWTPSPPVLCGCNE